MKFRELSDEEWRFVEPFLPLRAKTGRPRADDRRTVNGMLYVLIAGCRWMDMPLMYGSYKACWRRLKEWSVEGVWSKVLEALVSKGYSLGKLSLERVALDSTTIQARKGGARRIRRLQKG